MELLAKKNLGVLIIDVMDWIDILSIKVKELSELEEFNMYAGAVQDQVEEMKMMELDPEMGDDHEHPMYQRVVQTVKILFSCVSNAVASKLGIEAVNNLMNSLRNNQL